MGENTVLAICRAELMKMAINDYSEKQNTNNQKFAIVIEVDNVDSIFKTLKTRKVNFINQPVDMPHWGLRVVHFTDPENNLFEFYSELPAEKIADELRQEMDEYTNRL